MVKDLCGLKTEGYDVADDADSVLGPVDAAQTRALLRGVGDNRDADGNIAFPGRFAYRDNGLPSFDSPKPPEAPKEDSFWPTKNEDGSYQLAPGAKLVLNPMTDEEATKASGRLPTGIGAIAGALFTGNPWVGAGVGSTVTPFVQDPLKEVLTKTPNPRVEIVGGPTSSMGAPDYPNSNREDF